MRLVLFYTILLLVLCGISPLPSYAGDIPLDNQQVVGRVAAAFPQECENRQYCILLSSIQRCVGCGILAVNSTIEIVHQIDPSTVCIVVLAVEDRREAEVVRQKFLSPFFFVDTASALLVADRVQQFPELLVVDREGRIAYHRSDLQHADPDYLSLRHVLKSDTPSGRTRPSVSELPLEQQTATRVAKVVQPDSARADIYLEEPESHPVSRLSAPVYDAGQNRLAAINTLTNSIDIWRATDGKCTASVVLPDSIRYRFRKDSTDWRWRDMENQGTEIAKFRSLAFAGDTLYALVDILGGYTKQMVVGKTPLGTIDSMLQIVWQSRCIIARVHNGSFLSVIDLPDSSTLVQLSVSDGIYGGTSLRAGFTNRQSVTEQRDAIRRFAFYRGEPPVVIANPALTRAEQYIAKMDGSTVFAIGKMTTAADRTLWYCAPENGTFLYLRFPDRLQRLEPQGALQRCDGSLLLGEKAAVAEIHRRASYTLTGMTACNNSAVLLLESRDSSSAHTRYIMQCYSTDGAFQGERQPAELRDGAVTAALVAGSDNTHIVVLARTPARRWKLLHLSVPGSDTSPVSQGNMVR
jgi:hypothetical protein